MTQASKPVVKCLKCKQVLDEPSDIAETERKPCPVCGSLSRHFEQKIEEGVPIHDCLDTKARHAESGKSFKEIRVGDSLSRKTKKWMDYKRIIDRENDWYEETVIDPETGEVIHRCAQPLSKHRGHGSVKQKKTKK